MTGLLWVLIFGVAYPLIAMTVWTAGAFGIAATMPELRASCLARAQRQWTISSHVAEYSISYLRSAVAARWFITAFAGLLWPFAVPVWLGYRKGSFIADALEKRAEKDAVALTKVRAA